MSELLASNEQNQPSVRLAGPDHRGPTCADDHPRVEIIFPDECGACGGSDDWCNPFCPICDYCGGC